ncbi:SRPBCC family protein [Nocardioides sp. MAHUQ-72]|uniref:SRPBCC family protein n=1 Tax=unclassified Nocardioides TaxID=2615069 RepID=UPI0036153F45
MSQVQKSSHVEVVVDATVAQVWAVVGDVTRIGEWSHECRAARWLGGAAGPTPGARFRGRNRAGWARWGRTCEILAATPHHELVWRTVPTPLFPDSTVWRILLEPREDRTLITQSFTVLRAPWLLDRLYARLIPAHQDRDARLAQDLARVGAVAHRGART